MIDDTFNEHFTREIECGAYTVFKKGIYPTKKDAEKAIKVGTLYVYEENHNIAGSIIIDEVQSREYAEISWEKTLKNDEVMVIHLLIVHPSMTGKGVASSLVKYAMELARNNSCKH